MACFSSAQGHSSEMEQAKKAIIRAEAKRIESRKGNWESTTGQHPKDLFLLLLRSPSLRVELQNLTLSLQKMSSALNLRNKPQFHPISDRP